MGLFGKSSGGPAVGIDIGSSLIKVVEAKPGKNGVQITALGVAPTPPGTIDNEIIVDPQVLGQAVKQLLSESGISCKQSVSSVSGQSSVIVRIIEVPRMTRQELAETMKWEIERHVPFAADEVVMDFQPVDRPEEAADDQNMEVLLAVAQEETINRHVETLFAAGLEPNAVDVESLAAARSLIDVSGNGALEETIAVVNIGSTTTELAVYQKGVLAFPRTLPIAGKAITQALSDNLGISFEQAERLKREQAVVLLDRAASFAVAPGISGLDSPGVADTTVDFSAPDAADSGDPDFGFIPGLGFTQPSAEEESAPQPDNSMPDFDIDIGGSSESSKPAMDFDLSAGDDDFAAPPAPQFDLSEMTGEDGSADLASGEADAADSSEQSADGPVELVDYAPEAVFDAMAPVLADLMAEVRRSIEYYASRFHGQPDRIVLCGGTAKLKDLDKLIETELGIPATVGNPLQNLTVLSRSLSSEYLEEVATIFPVCVGLAIRDLIGE